ncbi:MAG TPA: hypothetical protein DGT23_15515 [Micromonosporaceae bacterium]|nr:hypothetical protein [Micromonosporaceae bacterium]
MIRKKQHRAAQIRTFTVVGLVHPETKELLVAGVIEGQHEAAEHRVFSPGKFLRWCDFVDATSADEAEENALQWYREAEAYAQRVTTNQPVLKSALERANALEYPLISEERDQ